MAWAIADAHGVRVDTDRVRQGDVERAERLGITTEELRQRMFSEAPLGRDGTVVEVADVAVLKCSRQASYITGSLIRIDGGRIPLGF